MPQLLPFYYVNEISFVFIALFILIYFFSIYILPAILQLFITRIFIIKL